MSANLKILFLQVSILKVSISLVIALMLSYFQIVNVFEFGDFNGYKDPPNYNSIIPRNFLYSDLIYLVGANSISHPLFLLVAVLGAIFVDWLCLIIFMNFSENKLNITFPYILFCLHPYFSIYTFRLTTDFFAKIACVIFLTYVFFPKKMSSALSSSLIIFMAMFRIYALVFLLGICVKKLRSISKNRSILESLFVASVFLCVLIFLLYINLSYLRQVFVDSKSYGLSQSYTINLLGDFGALINGILHYIYRLFILLGGREEIFTDGIEVFLDSPGGRIQLLVFSVLAIFHFFCFLFFLRFCISKQVFLVIIFPLSILMLSLFSVGHMRYLLSYYPMILVGWFFFAVYIKKSLFQR